MRNIAELPSLAFSLQSRLAKPTIPMAESDQRWTSVHPHGGTPIDDLARPLTYAAIKVKGEHGLIHSG
jgi:hypothetical protein